MSKIIDPNNKALNQGDDICDYRIDRIVELEEILVEKLGKWIEHRRIEQTEKEDRKMLKDLILGADEVLSRWL